MRLLMGAAVVVLVGCGLPGAVAPTPEAVATATERPTLMPATATPDGPYILFKDDFSDPESGWDRATFPEGVTDYGDAVYRITAIGPGRFLWATPGLDVGDVRVRVSARWVGGEDDNAFGLVCRQADAGSFYALMVTSDGFAGIRRRLDGGPLETLTGDGALTQIRGLAREGSIRLMAECVGTRLSLFANERLLLEVEDDALTRGMWGWRPACLRRRVRRWISMGFRRR